MLCLPHVSAICNWLTNVDYEPRFLTNVIKVCANSNCADFSLVIYNVYAKKQTCWESEKFTGFSWQVLTFYRTQCTKDLVNYMDNAITYLYVCRHCSNISFIFDPKVLQIIFFEGCLSLFQLSSTQRRRVLLEKKLFFHLSSIWASIYCILLTKTNYN